MVDLDCEYSRMSRYQAQMKLHHHGSRFLNSESIPPSSSSANKLSPAIVIIIIVLAVVFFVSGILHFLVRFLTRHRSSSVSESNIYPETGSGVLQGQLQQLFHLHDSGLDQAFIDALPVFLYKDLKGLNNSFDCPVCLCEFTEKDRLRLLPLCSHAFHIDCIDTWLLSNSTCPLCRGSLQSQGAAFENPIFGFDDLREEEGCSGGLVLGEKSEGNEIGRRVFSVRLGKFRSTTSNVEGDEEKGGNIVEGETSTSSNLDARRCYSMGSYQYVVADLEVEVSLRPKRPGGNGESMRINMKGRVGKNGNSNNDSDSEAKKIGGKGESFSVSKIWLWPKKGKLLTSAETQMATSSSANVGLPWSGYRSQET